MVQPMQLFVINAKGIGLRGPGRNKTWTRVRRSGMDFQHRGNCQTLPSFLSLLARISALTGAIALALEIMTPKRGQNTAVNHDMSDMWKFQLL